MKELIVTILLFSQALTENNLDVKFQWRELDFMFPSENSRTAAIERGDFIPENNLPLGLEVYENRLFITVPRWKSGVAASLAYIEITDSKFTPKLRPYPNWSAHNLNTSTTPEIVSPFRIKADQCGRLWVLDTGLVDLLGDTKILAPARISVYNLKNDSLIRQFTIPSDQLKEDSFLGNIAVEVVSCDDTYAYVADLGKGALIVYSWMSNSSWKINHNYFNIDPIESEFNVSGIKFQWTDGLFGIALTPPDERGFSTLYFHPLVSRNEFSVSTEILRDPKLARSSYHKFTNLGTRGPRSQSTASAFHWKSNVLFYGLVNLNAVGCWKTTKEYNERNQGMVYQDDVYMIFPNDVKVDANDNLWVLSDRLPKFMYEKLDSTDVNFRIFTAPVSEAIKGTVCDSSDLRGIVLPPSTNQTVERATKLNSESAASFQQMYYPVLILLSTFLCFTGYIMS
nr:yellow-b [Henosepilachna vigintioctopunctata]